MIFKKYIDKFLEFFDEITEKQLLTTTIVLVIVSVLVIGLSFSHYFSPDHHFYENLLVEAHGMIFDLLIIGLLLVWLNKNGERRLRIRRYHEEIDDFRHWVNEEASFRIAGNVKRLNKDGVTNIDLYNCFLKNVNLSQINLSASNMNYINLEDSNLQNSILDKVRLNQANLQNTKFQKSSLKAAQLSGANLIAATLIKADLTEANLIKSNFTGAVMIDAILKDSLVAGSDFTDANLFKADFRGAKGLTADQLSKAKNITLAQFDPEMEEKLMKEAPQLFGDIGGKKPVAKVAQSAT
ncbi:MAG: pentapeptide repeat-containing protein [Cytophagales bacterium]|nr:pentapeptide repeat-containing protein [Cytophagales bacterium]